MKLVFEFERETKNTYRFRELNDEGIQATQDELLIGVLYVQKVLFNGQRPDLIGVEIKVLTGTEADEGREVE